MAARSFADVRPVLSRALADIPSRLLQEAVASNWSLLAGLIAQRVGDEVAASGAQGLLSVWTKAVRLERACFARAHGRTTVVKGLVRSNDPDFRREYSALIFRVAEALSERVPRPEEVDAPPERLAPAAVAPFARLAELRRDTRVVVRDSATERCPRAGCGSKKISVKSFQTRSTDEAPTVASMCNDCGHRWRN